MKKNYDLVHIFWHDAAMHGTEQISIDDVKNYGLVYGHSVGWLIDETKTHITLAMDFFPASSIIQKDNFRTLQSYPKSGIEKMTRIKNFAPKKTKKTKI